MQINEFDQMEAAVRDLAKLLAAYRKHLLDEGFSSVEAMILVAAYQTALTTGSSRQS